MKVLDDSGFLAALGNLLDINRTSGTVYLQVKRYAGRVAAARRRNAKRQEEAAQGVEPQCLVRARSNLKKKSKISTFICAQEITKFQLGLGNIMRLHMDGLKRREKKKQDEKKRTKPVKKDTLEKGKAKPDKPGKEMASAAATGSEKEATGKKKGK
eukprot:CAMPEP_0179102972 /NCGR_PEP_ID=MMETSP0796-20121207/47686_1 /TAXON_ID=73915 /ORGANISM="Pyrodinium bahamense, Strain pbaha01" /LENGTH=155 /DNA_ID=CAMNT_0020800861 /DNA_START=74 /DNA_END=541 /DNA_ORIENTATION=+